MTTQVEKSIQVNVPISTAYNQWTQFEDFPQFMGGVTSVTQLGDDRMEWVAEIAGVKRQWEARVLEQIPDQKVAWAATTGATNAGHVTFQADGPDSTTVTLYLEYEPEGLVEKAGDKLGIVSNQAQSDLEKFKKFIESEGYATGAWRGSVNEGAGVGTPGVEHADASRGDDGKAGVSGKAVAAGVGLAAAAAAGVAAAVGKKSSSDDTQTTTVTPVESAPVSSTPVGSTYTDTSYTDSTTGSAGLTTGAQSGSASTGIDAPLTGSYQESTPHVLTDEDIEERTPDAPVLADGHIHDADGTDAASHGHDADDTSHDADGSDGSGRL